MHKRLIFHRRYDKINTMMKKYDGVMGVRSYMNMMQALNIVVQSFFNLLTPIGLALLASWLLVEKAGAPGWLYAALVFLGVGIGFYSMIRFLLVALAALERLEKEQEERDRGNKKTKK